MLTKVFNVAPRGPSISTLVAFAARRHFSSVGKYRQSLFEDYGVRRACAVREDVLDPQRKYYNRLERISGNNTFLVSSDATTQQLMDSIVEDTMAWRDHEAVFLEFGRRTDVLLGAFLWESSRGQPCGGIRMWEYDDVASYIKDGLRLATGMGLKSALAGLWSGGGKGVICREPGDTRVLTDRNLRRAVMQDYGDFLSGLRGAFVCAEDVGLVVSDLDMVHSRSRFVTCISEDLGGSGNPSLWTAQGVARACEAARDHHGFDGLNSAVIAQMGLGNVGSWTIVNLLRGGAAKVKAVDVRSEALELTMSVLKKECPNDMSKVELGLIEPGDLSIMGEECDILIPNALGGVLNDKTVPTIKAKIVCGAANNQLADVEKDSDLSERGITYVSESIASRMGIVNCSIEPYGRLNDDPYIMRHLGKEWEHSVYQTTRRVLARADEEHVSAGRAALELATEEAMESHPIWKDRARHIVADLWKHKWVNGLPITQDMGHM
eukprot:Clim_evm138s157 gene=Clim_evmTU138s157